MENKKDTELAILLSAEKEFMLKGLAGARTTEIAKGANVTHTMLHYYFRTKEALFAKVVERKFSSMIKGIEEVLHRQDVDIITKFELLLEAHFNFLVENPRLPLILFSDFYPSPSSEDNGTGASIAVLKKFHDIIFSNCQKEVDLAIREGRMRHITVDNILVDIVGLNLASVALVRPFSKITHASSEEFLRQRLQENKKTLRYRISPEYVSVSEEEKEEEKEEESLPEKTTETDR